jgi:2,4'-dihydroxyacetophenone dioxygenase
MISQRILVIFLPILFAASGTDDVSAFHLLAPMALRRTATTSSDFSFSDDDTLCSSRWMRLAASLVPSDQRTSTNNDSASSKDERFQPYRGEQPAEALSEIFVTQVLPDDDEEKLWVPQTDCVDFRPLCLCVSGGYYVNLLRVRGAGVLSRHRHPGPVHAHVLKGQWRYLEHDWIAKEGSYVFEPPGEIHTLVVPEGVDEMITLFHVTGSLLYCDVDGNVVGADDVFTKLELAKKHYGKIGLGEEFVQQFVR